MIAFSKPEIRCAYNVIDEHKQFQSLYAFHKLIDFIAKPDFNDEKCLDILNYLMYIFLSANVEYVQLMSVCCYLFHSLRNYMFKV